MTELNNKILNATKWSTITEIIAKLITPITSIILARLLAPEAFGVVATLAMIISFAEIFTDAGFQKYLIQHEFKNEDDRIKSTNVAFWSNLSMSLIIWGIIGIYSEKLSVLVGNPGLGNVLTIACISIPLTAFSSIQMALYKRNLDYKTLFRVRLTGICVPLVTTIPLAFLLKSYWALVIGTITSNIANAFLLTIYSSWKPQLYFSFLKLKEMLSFSIWSMIEAISIWLTSYIDIFVIGIYLNEYYLGLYKTSMTVVGQITGLVISATTPILFSSLSRLQNDENSFKNLFFKFQKTISILIIPMGVGIFCYSDYITRILLGNQWMEASHFIGLWGLTSAITIVISHYSSEVYRAKGRPKLSVLSQFLHIIVLCPALLISVKYGFEVLCTTRALIRFELILVNVIIMYIYIKISIKQILYNIYPSIVASIIMSSIAFILSNIGNSILWQTFSIIACIISYTITIYYFPNEKYIIKTLIQKIRI